MEEPMNHLRFKAAVAVGALAIVGGSMLLAAACSSSDKADATPSATVAATQANTPASDAPAVISAINILDNAGLHGFDQSIAGGTVPPTAQNVVTHLLAIVKLTPWPDALKTQASNMAGVFQTYVQQLNTNTPDMTKLATASHNAHEGEHDFSHDVWDWTYKQAGMDTTAPSGDSD
jgi:hypothetical protein